MAKDYSITIPNINRLTEAYQLELLKKIKCDKIQGYYISQPVEEVLFYKCIEHYNIEAIEKEAVI